MAETAVDTRSHAGIARVSNQESQSLLYRPVHIDANHLIVCTPDSCILNQMPLTAVRGGVIKFHSVWV